MASGSGASECGLMVISPMLAAGLISFLLYFHQTTMSILVRLWVWLLRVFIHPRELRSLIYLWLNTLRTRIFVNAKEQTELLRWVAARAERIKTGTPRDFGPAWKDGALLNALAESLWPGSCPRYDLLGNENARSNIKRALTLIEKNAGIRSGLEAEEVVTCAPRVDRKLMCLVSRLKRFSTQSSSSKEPNSSGSAQTLQNQEMEKNQECFAKGMGLLLAVRGRVARFNLYLKSTSRLNIVVEIRGPGGTICSERISDRSPRKKCPSKEGDSPNQTVGKIPLEYEVMTGMICVGYTPLLAGRHKLSIIWQGQHIVGSPYAVAVDEAADVNPADTFHRISTLLPHSEKSNRIATTTPLLNGQQKRKAGSAVRRKVLRHILSVQGKEVIVEDADQLVHALKDQGGSGRLPPQRQVSYQMPDEADCSVCSRVEAQEIVVQTETDPDLLARQDELVRRLSVPKVTDNLIESENLKPTDDDLHCGSDVAQPFEELQEDSGEDIADEQTEDPLQFLDNDEVFLLDENPSNDLGQDTECTEMNEIAVPEVDECHQSPVLESSVHGRCQFFEKANPQLSLDIDCAKTVNSRRRFFESLSELQKSPSISPPERLLGSSSFRRAKDFWEGATLSQTLPRSKRESISTTEQTNADYEERSPFPPLVPHLIKPLLLTPAGSDGDSGIHVPSFRNRSRSDPGQSSSKGRRKEEPFFYRTNPLFMLEPGAFASDLELTASTSPATMDDRGFIDDEIPDYAAHCMGGGYVSFTGLLDGDRLMSRRELLMGLEAVPMTSGEEEFFLPRSEKCRAMGAGLHYGQVAMRNQFQVRTEGAGKGFLTVSVQGAGDHDVIEVTTTYTGQDTYEVMYEVTEPGYYIISIKWSEWNVPESPFICKVTY